MSGHPIPVRCGEFEGHPVKLSDDEKWVAVQVTAVNDPGGNAKVGYYTWVWPSDLDVFGHELAGILAELRGAA